MAKVNDFMIKGFTRAIGGEMKDRAVELCGSTMERFTWASGRKTSTKEAVFLLKVSMLNLNLPPNPEITFTANGNRFEGSFSNGVKHGEGTFFHCSTGQVGNSFSFLILKKSIFVLLKGAKRNLDERCL